MIVSNTANAITVATPNENGFALANVAAAEDTYSGSYLFDNVAFRRGGNLKVGDSLEVTDTMTIAEYGMLTHFDADTSFVSMLDLTAGTLVIETGSRIDVTGRGYLGGKGV